MNKKENIKTLKELLIERGHRISKAKRVRTLLQKQKGLFKDKQKLTNFKEPVVDLHRRDGGIETYEHATAGKFVFTHSNGKERYIELRPSDQGTRDYMGRKIRWYTCQEDRPFAGFENPVVDGESVMLGYEKTKATDLKYQERLQRLKNSGNKFWIYLILAIAGAIAIGLFAISTWAPQLLQKAPQIATNTAPPTAGLILTKLKWRKK